MKNSIDAPYGAPDKVRKICLRYANRGSDLIEVLHDVQAALGFVDETAQKEIAEALNITRAEVHGVISFYDDFRSEAAPGTIVRVCRGEACQSMGAENLLPVAEELTKGRPRIGVEAVYCLGNCALAPAVTVGGTLHGRVEKDHLVAIVEHAALADEASE